MRTVHSDQSGFSTVELIITLFIGFLFLTMGFQLYNVIINRTNNQYDLIIANWYLSTQLDYYTNYTFGSNTPGPLNYTCPTSPQPYNETSYTAPDGSLYRVRVSCPNPTELPNLRLMVIYYKYQTAEAVGARYFITQ